MEINATLFELIKNNKFDELKIEIQKDEHIDVNIKDETGNYLIAYAIIKNSLDIVKFLLSKGARIDITDQEGKSLLYLPIKYGYNDMITLILEYDKLNIGISIVDFKDTLNNIPLHYAIFFKNIHAMNLLLNANSNPNTIDQNGSNSLHLAIYSKNYEICKKIVDSDININARTPIGETALHIACNFQLEQIIKLLVDHRIDLNAQDFNNEITALIYSVNLNNKKIPKFLLDQGADPNIQDFIGNTAIHYSILEENYEILHYLITSKNTKPNVNIYNISGKLPIHLLLEKDVVHEGEIIKKLINMSNLNSQDFNGDTPLHLICKKNLWSSFKDELQKKKLNIFVNNYNNEMPVNYITKQFIHDFMTLVANSYIYTLQNNNSIWKNDWENICSKEFNIDNFSAEEINTLKKYTPEINNTTCFQIIYNKLMKIYQDKKAECGNTSIPQKLNKKCIVLDERNNVELCSFVGITLDILLGLVYLLNKYNYSCSTITKNFMDNTDLCNYYKNIGIKTNSRCEFLNFEIVWIYKKLFFSENFTNHFKKCMNNIKIRFIVIPLGIELEQGSHANYLIFDKKTFELERFEPYGSHSPYKFNYNSKLLDNVLTFKFTEIDNNIKYISPEKYLPKIGFQYFDVYESKTQKIGDPGGFCGLWSIWYTDMRLTYPDIERKSLVNKLLKEIKRKNISFKNLIRNYSTNITKLRDEVFEKAKITINDWLNDQISKEQYDVIISELTKLLNKIVN